MIAEGHRVVDIYDYTWPQYLAFQNAAQRHHATRSEELLMLLFVGSRGSESSMKELQDFFKKVK